MPLRAIYLFTRNFISPVCSVLPSYHYIYCTSSITYFSQTSLSKYVLCIYLYEWSLSSVVCAKFICVLPEIFLLLESGRSAFQY